jgi:hypothetical protein
MRSVKKIVMSMSATPRPLGFNSVSTYRNREQGSKLLSASPRFLRKVDRLHLADHGAMTFGDHEMVLQNSPVASALGTISQEFALKVATDARASGLNLLIRCLRQNIGCHFQGTFIPSQPRVKTLGCSVRPFHGQKQITLRFHTPNPDERLPNANWQHRPLPAFAAAV